MRHNLRILHKKPRRNELFLYFRERHGKARREEIPGFAWLRAKNKPNFFPRGKREKQKKNKKQKKTPKNTQKIPKKYPRIFFALTREIKAEKKLPRLRAKKIIMCLA